MVSLSVRILVVSALVALLAETALATVVRNVTYLGTDSTTSGAWRSTDVAKTATFDYDRDNAYGSDGYYVAYGMSAWTNPADVSSALPSYIESVTVDSALSSYGYEGYPKIDNPEETIGAGVADLPSTGIWNMVTSSQHDFFKIKLTTDKTFILTTILGTNTAGASQATAVTVAGTGVSDSASYSWSGHPDYAFFNISGLAGDEFTVSLTPGSTAASTSGIAFEASAPLSTPEPATCVSCITAVLGLLAYAWRKRS
jgi:hypothetical protein